MPEVRGRVLMTLTLILGISACAGTPTGMSGRWTGTVRPISGTCDPAGQAVLDIKEGGRPPYAAAFSPSGGVLTLHGNSDGAGQIDADIHTTGMNHHPYILSFSGTRHGDTITGIYTTQRCRSEVVLQKTAYHF